MKIKSLDLSFEEWTQWCLSQNYPKFCASQIFDWIYKKKLLKPLEFSNLSMQIRQKLFETFDWDLMEIDSHLISVDKSEKLVLKTLDNLLIEMVIMPYESRTTLCISSQIGCRMGCHFCQTGRMGLQRNLSSGEILYQIILAHQLGHKITNVVFMGMGEPLDNYDETVKACLKMVDLKGFGLSKSKVTISTSGIIPQINQLGHDLPVRLAISLHSADEKIRSEMMPVNNKYPLKDLKEALLNYPAPIRYGITFEYVLIENKNDSLEDAKKLVHFLHGLKAKVNLIPINLFPGLKMKPSQSERIALFQKYLVERSIPAPVRYSRGQDISGGCGQLAAKRQNELHLDPRMLFKLRRKEAQLQ